MRYRYFYHQSARVLLGLIFIGWLTVQAQVAKQPATVTGAGAEHTIPNSPANRAGSESILFEFSGGTLAQFIDKLDKHFGVDVRSRATIEVGEEINVPKLRVSLSSTVGPQETGIYRVLTTYNSLGRKGFPRLGAWFTEGGYDAGGLPNILTLTPLPDNGASGQSAFKLRAYSIKGMTQEKRELLERTIGEGIRHLSEVQLSNGVRTDQVWRGGLRFSESAELLLASGTEAYLGVVQEIVNELPKLRQAGFGWPPKAQESDSKKP